MANNEIKTLLPGENITLLSGERVVIRPVPFGKLPEFFEDIDALVRKFLGKGNINLITDAKFLLQVAFEEVIRIAGKIIGKRRAWWNTIDIADGIAIVNVILRQNIDNERAKKNLTELIARGTSLLPTQYKPLSAEAIASEILKDTHPDKSGPSQPV
jgi:hypothetical protein